MEKVKQVIFQSDRFRDLRARAGSLTVGEPLEITGVAGSLLAFVAAAVFEERQTQALLIASDGDRAEKLRDDVALLVGEPNVRFFGARPHHEAQMLDVSSSIAQIETLKTLAGSASPLIIVASPESIAEKVPEPKQFSMSLIELRVSGDYPFQKLLGQLERLVFERKDFVEGYGDFAVRGGIVDVFPYVGENPIRFEFWGDTIESIREFDVLSQRSIRELQSASIVPSIPMQSDGSNGGLPLADSSTQTFCASLFDYLQREAVVILDEPTLIEREIKELAIEGTTNLFTFDEILTQGRAFPLIVNSLFEGNQSKIENPRLPGGQGKSKIDFGSSTQPSFNGSIDRLVDVLDQLTRDGCTIYLASDTKEETERLRELIEEVVTSPEQIQDSRFKIQAEGDGAERELIRNSQFTIRSLARDINPQFLTETIHSGFVFNPAKLAVFTEHEIFGRLKRRGIAKRRRFKGFSQKELQQLKRGDYIVHVDHGIGTFAGLTKINVAGVEQEVMRLLFADDDVLYVNLNFINRVQKYSSQEGHVPKISKLGAPDWERMKSRAKRRIKEIARDLIALYARRKSEQGTAFAPDTHWQKELEASFMYEDTPDQSTATIDVKRDMESPSPMDRLICGDVGFGKTEVAVRAAFKAVMSGKQVAMLVPTTILALQHYNTFLDRLSRYTTRVENLTRFKSKNDQQRIVDGLKRGSIDIIIGTHRLLSKDIGFKDLGLLILDEEHRFGVSAKEKLRQLKATVDTLTLTATPIPRTLHFSLIGARDLSLINTPPRNRLPIVTEIIPGSDGRQSQWHIIREAILKELHRGGQVYFVHDRVQNIDAIADQVKIHVPEARVRVAHGQMHGHQLEKTMLDFLEKKFDVLVATKIIESGLDIPSVNTIVINRADRFGLAELYQLRGRVGRSNVQAYAYLLVPPLSVLPKPTLRRLQAIEEFTELGSGFNLAMRDLEIRGAGNLLGAEQSGFIIEMGFEMYERIVRESVEELKQEEFKDILPTQERTAHTRLPGEQVEHRTSIETVVDADVDALIPDFYIESDTERLDVYRRLYRARTGEELQSMRAELRDRFGEYPEEVEHLFLIVELRLAASRAGLQKVTLRGSALTIALPDQSDERFYGTVGDDSAPFQRMMKQISERKSGDVHVKQIGKELSLLVRLPQVENSIYRLKGAKQRLEEITVGVPVTS